MDLIKTRVCKVFGGLMLAAALYLICFADVTSVTATSLRPTQSLGIQLSQSDISSSDSITYSNVTYTSVDIYWDAIHDVSDYHIIVNSIPISNYYSSVNGTGIIINHDKGEHSANIQGLTPLTKYYIRIWVIKISDIYLAYDSNFSTIPSPTLTTKLIPSQGATNVSINTPFVWGSADGAIGYELEIATSPDYIDAVSIQTESMSYLPQTPLEYDQNYYWRVRALGIQSAGIWAAGVFTTEAITAPVIVTQVAPQATLSVALAPATTITQINNFSSIQPIFEIPQVVYILERKQNPSDKLIIAVSAGFIVLASLLILCYITNSRKNICRAKHPGSKITVRIIISDGNARSMYRYS
jgi:hypothetical protein